MKEKSNRVYKLAAVLMVLCLITACVIGTTLAKYTTSGSGSDTAQVAKWGVKVEIQNANGVFANKYTNDSSEETVISSNTDIDVVAPGTSSPNALTFSISGKPEVSAKVEFVFTATNDVFVKAGVALTDPVTSEEVTVSGSEDYHPVKFTLQKKNGESWDNVDGATGVSLAEIKTVIEKLCTTTIGETTSQTVYAPNTDLATTIGTYQLSWAWAYDDASGANDKYDTFLGNCIAENATDATNWSTSISYTLSITVTQVD